MRHIRFVLIGSVIALLSATAAQATVIYNWHSTSPGTYVTATDGELVFTDAAYRAGGIDFYALPQYRSDGITYNYETGQITNSPVVSAGLNFDAGPGAFVQPGSYFFADIGSSFSGALTFNDDGTLSGSLFLYDFSNEVSADGTHDDWTVFNYGSDYFAGELCGPPTCGGGSGYWQFSRVPEPPVWPLFGLGVFGLFGLLRLRRKA